MRKYVAGVGSLLALAVILVGVPFVLIVTAGNPLPTAEQVNSVLALTPDYGNVILVGKVLPLIGWIAWAFFALTYVDRNPRVDRRAQHPQTFTGVPIPTTFRSDADLCRTSHVRRWSAYNAHPTDVECSHIHKRCGRLTDRAGQHNSARDVARADGGGVGAG